MAENIVVKEVLTDGMIAAGEQLIEELDRRAWPVEDAAWLYDAEYNRWKLVVSSPNIDTDGPKRAYEIMRSALEAVPTAKAAITLYDVTVQSPTEPLIAAMGKTLDTGPTLKRIRLHQAGIGGHLIEDGLVYRST